LTEQIKTLKASAAKAQIGTLLDKQREGRKLDDRQVKFIQNRLQRFEPKDPDAVEKEFGTFLDSEIDEYGRLAKDVFGIEPDKGKDIDGGKEGSFTSPEKDKPAGDDKSKYIDPKTNPFIRA